MANAVEHPCELVLNEVRHKMEQLPVEADRVPSRSISSWETVDGPLYQAWIELLIASRTDAYLRDSTRAVKTRLTESVEKTLSGLFVPVIFEHSEPVSLCGHALPHDRRIGNRRRGE